jgi:RHS repeat-associated protein
VRQDAYFNLSGVTYSADAYIGTANTNYYSTVTAFDSDGRAYQVTAPTGTITQQSLDSLGRVTATSVGTSTSNLVQVSSAVYDAGGVGDGNLTQQTFIPGGTAANRVTNYYYDWRNRLVATKSGVLQGTEDTTTHRPIIYNTYDNLGEVTQVQQFDGDTVTIIMQNGVPQPPSSSLLRAQSKASYDDQGRVYQMQVFDVNQSSGAVSSSALTTNKFYDRRGLLIAQSNPGGLWTKTSFDGVGRPTVTYATDGGVASDWNAAVSVAGDHVLEQTETQYDKDGNAKETIVRQRFHNETLAAPTGLGPLVDPTHSPMARVYYSAAYFDLASRETASVNVGTNGGATAPWTRPDVAPPVSDTVLLTTMTYNDQGLLDTVTDPKGLVSKTFYDNLGRVTKTVAAYTGGGPSATSDQTTEYGYDGDNNRTFVQVDLPNGAVQKTAYFYGVSTATGSDVNSNDLFAATVYPDPTTGQPTTDQQVTLTGTPTGGSFTLTLGGQTTAGLAYNADAATVQSALQNLSTVGVGNVQVTGPAGGPWRAHFTGALAGTYVPNLTGDGSGLTGGTSPAVAVATQQETYTVNALGQHKTLTDRNDNVHTFTFDVLGRQISDAVTTLGNGVDGGVRRIDTAFDTGDRPYLFTSYSDTTTTNIVNQVQDAFNGLGQLTTEYQAHSGAVNMSTTLNVQYAYTDLASGNNSRQKSVTYPNGRQINYNYASSGLDDSISRVSSISDNLTSITLESETYLGLGTVVQRTQSQAGIALSYIQQGTVTDGGDQYTGLDRFGRVLDQNWLNTGQGISLVRLQYGYDRNSNRLYANNLVNSPYSELYHLSGAGNGYDKFNQLTDFVRGTLSASVSGGVLDTVASASGTQGWVTDAVGNWTSFSTNGIPQARTANQQNQYTSVGAATPTYDSSGNLTKDERGYQFAYDAWNSLVQVKDASSNVVASYKYDAAGRRIQETSSGTTTDLYFNDSWQVVEERVGGVAKVQYVWAPTGGDVLVERDRDTAGDGTWAERFYAMQDANNNVLAMANALGAGAISERYAYDPYGSVTFMTATWGTLSASAYAVSYLFQAGRYDTATGLYNFRHRDLSPTLGRWLVNDPLGFGGGDVNTYRYVKNQPTVSTDASGMQVAPSGQAAPIGQVVPIGHIYSPPRTDSFHLPQLEQELERILRERRQLHPGAQPWTQAGPALPATPATPDPSPGTGSLVTQPLPRLTPDPSDTPKPGPRPFVGPPWPPPGGELWRNDPRYMFSAPDHPNSKTYRDDRDADGIVFFVSLLFPFVGGIDSILRGDIGGGITSLILDAVAIGIIARGARAARAHAPVDMHHGTPRQIIRNAPDYIDPRSIQGTRGNPNRVPVNRRAHRDAHNGGANGGQPRYNDEFQRRLDNIEFNRPLTPQDYWDIRERMLWEYFGI